MIKISNIEVFGWEAAIRGMRNPMNSWAKCDSGWKRQFDTEIGLWQKKFVIGQNDHDLAMRLAKAGSVHAKYRRMIVVQCDILAPLYWWKEFDTYKVGTVSNSCSTMHKIHAKEFTLNDFSHEHLLHDSTLSLKSTIEQLNFARIAFLETKEKIYLWEMIQLLPSSYNQLRTVQMSYEVLSGMYRDRRNHKLDEWRDFCRTIECLPYSDLITIGGEECVTMEK